MKCFKRSALSSMPYLSSSLFLCFCFGFICVAEGNASPNSTKNQIYNLTLCELNVTEYQSTFPYIVEAFVVSPMLTHALSTWFMTTSHFLDTLALISVTYLGYSKQRYVLSTLYLTCGVFSFIFFLVRFTRNVMALRFAWTRRTNFILDSRGNVHPNKSSVIVTEHGRVPTPHGSIEVKTVVLDGQKASLKKTVPAEQWEP